jgi:hypothetical protein
MNLISHAVLALLLCMIVTSCNSWVADSSSNDDTIAVRTPAIYGQALDYGGEPLDHAKFGLVFNYGPGQIDTNHAPAGVRVGPNPATDFASAFFHNSQSGRVVVQIIDPRTHATVKSIYDGVQPAGDRAMQIDVTDVPNQVYVVRINTPESTLEGLLVVNNRSLTKIIPLDSTDSEGRFVIGYNRLPTGCNFQNFDVLGAPDGWASISPSIRIVIVDKYLGSMLWDLEVDTTAVVDSTLMMR